MTAVGGAFALAMGLNTITNKANQFVYGKYNEIDTNITPSKVIFRISRPTLGSKISSVPLLTPGSHVVDFVELIKVTVRESSTYKSHTLDLSQYSFSINESNQTLLISPELIVPSEFGKLVAIDFEVLAIDTKGVFDRGKYLSIAGNGTSDNARSNAHTLDWDGNAWYQGNVTAAGGTITVGNTILTEAQLQRLLQLLS